MLTLIGIAIVIVGFALLIPLLSDLVSQAIPVDNRFLVVVAYCLGMAIFTMIMGNAFAAFPVITAAIRPCWR
ncbi:MAG: DUF979 family protein [Tumebacillaceae bacterium]